LGAFWGHKEWCGRLDLRSGVLMVECFGVLELSECFDCVLDRWDGEICGGYHWRRKMEFLLFGGGICFGRLIFY